MAESKNNFSNLGTIRQKISNLQTFAEDVKTLKKELILMYNKSYNIVQNKKKQKQEEVKIVVEEPVKAQIQEVKIEEAPKAQEEQNPQQITTNDNKRIYYPKNDFNQRPRYNNGYNPTNKRDNQGNNQNGYQPRGNYQGNNNGYRQNPNSNYQQNGNYQPRGNYQQNGNYQPRVNYQPRGNYQANSGYRPNPNGSFQNRGNYQGNNFQRPNNFNRPFGQRPNFERKPTLEPLPDFIKQQANKPDKKKKEFEPQGEKKTLTLKQKMRFGIINDDFSNEERMGSRKLKNKKIKAETQVAKLITTAVITTNDITVKSLSETISRPASEIIKQLMLLGTMKTINSPLDFETAELVASELGVTIEQKIEKSFEEKMKDIRKDKGETASKRPPIVTVMGHVDHGKTSLLDAIKKTNVIESEAGGITQRIGAYSINYNGENITFIDTPGHAAFSKMRARGAQITDVAVLVVAANDGIMPQTIESIKQIKLAGVPMIVAINKMDLPDANVDKVKQQLTEHEVIPEDWGGETICVPISAKTGKGIDKLIEMILLVSEVADLKADAKKDGEGVVLEAQLDKTRGAIANLIVQDGTLEIGDTLIAGTAFGKVRAMFDENGKNIKKAGPSMPVSVLGLDGIPSAGDYFYAVDEKLSKQVIEERKNKIKLDRIKKASTSLDDFYARVDDSKLKHFNIIIKADVQGSAEALEASLVAVSNEEVRVVCLSASAGVVNENDVEMAKNTGALIVVFNSKIDSKIETLAKREKIQIKSYKIIYNAIDEVEQMVKALKEPVFEETYLGKAECRVVFKLTSGTIAGSYVLDGKLERNAKARVLRDGSEIAQGTIETLKIQKDDKKEVATGFECGIKISSFSDFKEKDIIECFKVEEVKE